MKIEEVQERFRDGLTPSDLIEEVWAKIQEWGDPALFIHLPEREELLELAGQVEAMPPELPLWGIPFVVKDNIDVAGWPTTAACPAYAYIPQVDAGVVKRLRSAG